MKINNLMDENNKSDNLLSKVKGSKWFGWIAALALVLGTSWQLYSYMDNFYQEVRPSVKILEDTDMTGVAANGVLFLYLDVPRNYNYSVALAVYVQDSPAYYFKFDSIPRGSFALSVPFPLGAFGQPLIDVDVVWTVEHWTSYIEENAVYKGLTVEVSDASS